MRIDITSLYFNAYTTKSPATTAWATSIGQKKSNNCRIDIGRPGVSDILTGMLYKTISDTSRYDISKGSSARDTLLASAFDKVYVNGILLEGQCFMLFLLKEHSSSHEGRLHISYPSYAKLDSKPVNQDCMDAMRIAIGCSENGCWFVYDISVKNQDELHFSAIVVDKDNNRTYITSQERSTDWNSLVSSQENEQGQSGSGSSFFFFFFDEPTQQKIYYGCPGTGKSYEVKKLTEGVEGEKAIYFDADGKRIPTPEDIEQRSSTPSNVFRTTFHPDYDYATFVGTYKPIMVHVDPEDEESKEELSYKFVPQVFTNAYVRAYKSLEDETLVGADKNVYLIIEEINRGNCAQIFGDLFQLLDRTDGYSDYSITPDTELKDYLYSVGIKHDKLRLPANLHIYATMNTSDQSLFPMDSAFKRRWAMEYIPIKLSGNKAENYKISLYDHEFKWTDFLKQVNAKIRMATDSEDKQMGEFFVKSEIIELDEFRNKIMFYIWNDVCKEHYSATRLTASYFMRDSETSAFTFAELFGGRSGQKDMQDATPGELILGFMKYLGVEEIPEPTAE